MMKMLLAGVWVCVMLSGSIYFLADGGSGEGGRKGDDANGYFSNLHHVKLNPVTVAILRENEIKGYIIVESVFTFAPDVKDRLSVPIEFLLRDAIINAIHGNPDIDIFRIETFDLAAFQKKFLEDINARLGRPTIHDFLVRRIDFISKDDIRDKQLRRS